MYFPTFTLKINHSWIGKYTIVPWNLWGSCKLYFRDSGFPVSCYIRPFSCPKILFWGKVKLSWMRRFRKNENNFISYIIRIFIWLWGRDLRLTNMSRLLLMALKQPGRLPRVCYWTLDSDIEIAALMRIGHTLSLPKYLLVWFHHVM